MVTECGFSCFRGCVGIMVYMAYQEKNGLSRNWRLRLSPSLMVITLSMQYVFCKNLN